MFFWLLECEKGGAKLERIWYSFHTWSAADLLMKLINYLVLFKYFPLLTMRCIILLVKRDPVKGKRKYKIFIEWNLVMELCSPIQRIMHLVYAKYAMISLRFENIGVDMISSIAIYDWEKSKI